MPSRGVCVWACMVWLTLGVSPPQSRGDAIVASRADEPGSEGVGRGPGERFRELKSRVDEAAHRGDFLTARQLQGQACDLAAGQFSSDHWQVRGERLYLQELTRVSELSLLERQRLHVAFLLLQLAHARQGFQEHALAGDYVDEAADIIRGYLGPANSLVLFCVETRAQLLLARDELTDAETACHDALRMRAELAQEPHPRAGFVWHLLALIAERRKDFDLAASHLQKSLQMRRRVLAPHDLELAVCLSDLTRIGLRQGDHGMVQRSAGECLAICQFQKLPETMPLVAGVHESLMLSKIEQGQFHGTERQLRALLQLREQREDFGDTDRVAQLTSAYEYVLAMTGRTDDGDALLRRYQQMLKRETRR